MHFQKRIFIALAGALLFAVAPCLARADTVYYLVGLRHVYLIGKDKYAHWQDRKQIEEDYADAVAHDQAHYNADIAARADPRTEQASLDSALHDLAVERDRRLSKIYELADYERCRHQELQVKADGPYQVVGLASHMQGYVERPDRFTVSPPWPGYTAPGPTSVAEEANPTSPVGEVAPVEPYGWEYDVPYTPTAFVDAYMAWSPIWIGWGCPAYVGLCGWFGPVAVIGIGINPWGWGGFRFNSAIGGVWGGWRGYAAYRPGGAGYAVVDPARSRGGFVSSAVTSRSALYRGTAAARAGGGRGGAVSAAASRGGRTGLAAGRSTAARSAARAGGNGVAVRHTGAASHTASAHNALASRARVNRAARMHNAFATRAGAAHSSRGRSADPTHGAYIHSALAAHSGAGHGGFGRGRSVASHGGYQRGGGTGHGRSGYAGARSAGSARGGYSHGSSGFGGRSAGGARGGGFGGARGGGGGFGGRSAGGARGGGFGGARGGFGGGGGGFGGARGGGGGGARGGGGGGRTRGHGG